MATLRVIAGPAHGRQIVIASELALGRSENDAGMLGGDPQLSRRHARVYVDGGGRLIVEDLGSSNGTFVNGVRIARAAVLQPGSRVTVGGTTLEVVGEQRAAAPAPPPAAAPPPVARGPIALAVVAGYAAGTQLQVADELVIGRGATRDGQLRRDPHLSRRHCRIRRDEQGRPVIEDLGSRNGTFLNGTRISGAQVLQPGDRITVGQSALQLAAPAPDPARARPAAPRPVPAQASFAPGYYPAPARAAKPGLSVGKVLLLVGGGMALAIALAVVVVAVVAPSKPPAPCPPGEPCAPPTARPLTNQALYVSDLGYRLEYDDDAFSVAGRNPRNLRLEAEGDAGTVSVWVQGRNGSDTRALVDERLDALRGDVVGLQADSDPVNANLVPTVGFRRGTGGAYAGTADTPQGPGSPVVVDVQAATDGKVSVVASVVTSASDDKGRQGLLTLAEDVLNTVRWKGDIAR